jgi:hypothetical protein
MRYAMIVTLILAAGCGGETADPGRAPAAAGEERAASAEIVQIDPCSLLEIAEVEAVMGEPVRANPRDVVTLDEGRYFAMCTFDPVDEVSLRGIAVSYRTAPEIKDPAAALESHVRDMRESAVPEYELQPVAELGEGAGWDPEMRQVTVMRPGGILTVDGVDRDTAVRLTRAALARVP